MHPLLRLFVVFTAWIAFAPLLVAAEAGGKFVLTCLEIPDIQRGAGLAIVLQLPNGKTCLYDTGFG